MVRSSHAGRHVLFAAALTAVVASGVDLSAHRRDEYLQAARIAIDTGRIDLELDLTPGVALADAVIAAIDRDHDGVLSADERQTYAGMAISGVWLEIDGRPLAVQLRAATFPDVESLRRGEGTIRLRSAAALASQSIGTHQLLFRNDHHADRSVYLANALVPDGDRVTVTAQRRDAEQRELRIDYVLRGRSVTAAGAWLLGGFAGAAVLYGTRRPLRRRRADRREQAGGGRRPSDI